MYAITAIAAGFTILAIIVGVTETGIGRGSRLAVICGIGLTAPWRNDGAIGVMAEAFDAAWSGNTLLARGTIIIGITAAKRGALM